MFHLKHDTTRAAALLFFTTIALGCGEPDDESPTGAVTADPDGGRVATPDAGSWPGANPRPQGDAGPTAEPSCAEGQALADLPYLDGPTCLPMCAGESSPCSGRRACVDAEGAFVCAPLPELVSVEEVGTINAGYAVTSNARGQLFLFRDDLLSDNLLFSTAGSDGIFGEAQIVAKLEDEGSTQKAFGNMSAAADDDGRVAIMWNSSAFTSSGLGSSSLTEFSNIATFEPGSPVPKLRLLSAGKPDLKNYSDLAHNFDLTYGPSGEPTIAKNSPQTGKTLYGAPDALVEAWAPSNNIASMNLMRDARGAGHMFYIDAESGRAIYQYAPSDAPSTDESGLALVGSDQRPASIAAQIAPGGTIGVHITRREEGDTIFALADQPEPGAPIAEMWAAVSLVEEFGFSPLDHDITFSTTLGWIVCGMTPRGLECRGLSETSRGLERTVIPSEPLRNVTQKYGGGRKDLQVESMPDGSVHAFWITQLENTRTLHHAVIK